VGGTTADGVAATPPDGLLRDAPVYTEVTSGSERRSGRLYGYDPSNERIVAFLKATGEYVEQYRLAGGVDDWEDARGWYVEPGIADAPDTIVWITASAVRRAVLEPVTSAPGATEPAGAVEGSPSPTIEETLAP
jgi:hypothetical protein